MLRRVSAVIVLLALVVLTTLPAPARAQPPEPPPGCQAWQWLGRYGEVSRFPRDAFVPLPPGFYAFYAVPVAVREPYDPTINVYLDPILYMGNMPSTGEHLGGNLRIQTQFAVFDIFYATCVQSTPTPVPVTPTLAPTLAPTPGDCQPTGWQTLAGDGRISLPGRRLVRLELPAGTARVRLEIEDAETGAFVTLRYAQLGAQAQVVDLGLQVSDLRVRAYVDETSEIIDLSMSYMLDCPAAAFPTAAAFGAPIFGGAANWPSATVWGGPIVRSWRVGLSLIATDCYDLVPALSWQWDQYSITLPSLSVCVRLYDLALAYDNFDVFDVVIIPTLSLGLAWFMFAIARRG